MAKKIEGFHSVRSSTLAVNRRLAMDVFIPVHGRAVRFGAAGEILDDDRFARLRKFKIQKVFIQEDKEGVYRQYLEELMDQIERDSKIETSLKAQMVTGATESAMENVIERVDDKQVYTDAQLQFDRFAKFLQKHDGGFGEVIRLSGQVQGDYVCHGVQVAALSVFLCEKLKLIRSDEHRKQIATGCFIHDIAAEKGGLPLVFDKDSNMSAEQKKAWGNHPSKAIEILGTLNHIEQQVIAIVGQHEEIPNGSGFPKGLIRKNMDQVACVVSLANRFDHYSTRFQGDKRKAVAEFFKSELGKYELDQLELIRKVINEHTQS